jgi:hypothetical protein
MLIDEPELHREAAPKMSAAFLGYRAPSAAARSRAATDILCCQIRRRHDRCWRNRAPRQPRSLAAQPHHPSSQHRLVQPETRAPTSVPAGGTSAADCA